MEVFSFDNSFQNELEIMKKRFALNNFDLDGDLPKTQACTMSLKSPIRTQEFLEQGNEFMRSRNGDLKEAASLYTKAIIAARIESVFVSLAYFNRSKALKKLELLQAAYDDCVLALESKCRDELRFKISFLQAEFSIELGKIEMFQKHIDELNKMELNAECKKYVEALKIKSRKKSSINTENLKTTIEKSGEFLKIGREGTMITTKPIKQGEAIFVDQAFIICPRNDTEICHNCGINNEVPYPCVRCSGAVRYCSLKCQKDHYDVHKYECLSYDVDNTNIESVFLRLLIKGLPQILPLLKYKENADMLWSECFDNKEKHNELPYMQILKIESLWKSDKNAKEELVRHLHGCEKVLRFLSKCTNFFNLFINTTASAKDWIIFIGNYVLHTVDSA